MRIIGRSIVESLLDMSQAVELMRSAFIALDEGRAVLPQRVATRVEGHHGTHLSMPCYVRTENREVLSIKLATVFERNQEDFGLPGTMASLVLHDPRSGEILAMMDAEYLTAVRTGAASALATQFLALPEANTAMIFGAGGQAETQLEGVVQVRPIKQAFVFSKNREQSEEFAARMSNKLRRTVSVADDPKNALRESQIVCTATTSSEPVFDGRDLAPGTHINAIGSFRPDMRELDEETVRRSRIFADRLEAAQNGSGELIHAVKNGVWAWENLAGDLGNLAAGRIPGRISRDEITVFKSLGLAVQDAVVAGWIFERCQEADLGSIVDLSE